LQPSVVCASLTGHEGFDRAGHPSVDDACQASRTGWRESCDRRQPPDETAAPGYQSLATTRTQSLSVGPIPVGVLFTFSQTTPHSTCCRDCSTLDTSPFPREAKETKVSTAIFIGQTRKAWAERSIPRTHPGHPRIETAQSAIRMSSARATDQQSIRYRHR